MKGKCPRELSDKRKRKMGNKGSRRNERRRNEEKEASVNGMNTEGKNGKGRE